MYEIDEVKEIFRDLQVVKGKGRLRVIASQFDNVNIVAVSCRQERNAGYQSDIEAALIGQEEDVLTIRKVTGSYEAFKGDSVQSVVRPAEIMPVPHFCQYLKELRTFIAGNESLDVEYIDHTESLDTEAFYELTPFQFSKGFYGIHRLISML